MKKTISHTSDDTNQIQIHADLLRELLIPLSTYISDIRDLEVMFSELADVLGMKHIVLYRVSEQGCYETVCGYGPSSMQQGNRRTTKNMNLHIAWKTGKISSIPLPNFGDNIVVPVGIDDLFLAAGDIRHSREIAKIENALFELVGGIIANALRSMRLIEQANTDKLTGILNRGALDKYIYEGKNPFGRTVADPIAVCMMDIDHFKRFNDTFGHHVGDQVLRHVARTVSDVIGEENTVYRF